MIRDTLAKPTEPLTDVIPEQVNIMNTNTESVTNVAEMMVKQLAEIKNKIDSNHKEVKKTKSNKARSKSSTNKRVNKKSNKQIEDVPPCIEQRLRLIIEHAKQLTTNKQIKTLTSWLNDLNTKIQLLAMDEVDIENSEEESEE
jgi:23S rRNA pseudoU1915 N3-methylase RlmH